MMGAWGSTAKTAAGLLDTRIGERFVAIFLTI